MKFSFVKNDTTTYWDEIWLILITLIALVIEGCSLYFVRAFGSYQRAPVFVLGFYHFFWWLCICPALFTVFLKTKRKEIPYILDNFEVIHADVDENGCLWIKLRKLKYFLD